jgi:hypothetical protein
VGGYSYTEPDDPGAVHAGDLFVEFLGDAAYLVFYEANAVTTSYQGPFAVKSGEYWVLGDNRLNAHDSPMWWAGLGGGVPRGAISGRAVLVWLAVHGGAVDWTRTGTDLTRASLLPEMGSLRESYDKCMRDRPPRTLPPPPPR